MHPDRIYRHFCMMARALEVVGERWSLLIVRDLLFGPRRFTDLARTLSEITPARLTGRLRQLEGAGIIVREQSAVGREVWYRLTDAGYDLAPAVDALTLWGVMHALTQPLPGEPVNPVPVMIGTKVWLSSQGVPPAGPVTWVWAFSDDACYALRFDGTAWTLARGPARNAAVTVAATPGAWARFLTTPRASRRLPRKGIRLEASRIEATKFARAFRAKLGPARRAGAPR
jgi:DNA-binding HxlR family transcriptional regulator